MVHLYSCKYSSGNIVLQEFSVEIYLEGEEWVAYWKNL